MLTLSRPVELFLFCFIAAWTCVVVSVMLVVYIYVSVCFCVLCFIVLVNSFLSAFAICMWGRGGGESFLFESYCVVFGLFFLLANPCIVFQRVCVLCL